MALFRETLDIDTSLYVNIALMINVKNMPDVKSKVRTGALPCCLIKPSLIIDPMQIVIAANKAALKNKSSSMTTKSVFAEILFNLSLSRKITEALNLFGIDSNDTSVLVVFFEKPNEDIVETVLSQINGQRVDVERLSQYTDDQLVKKTYGITGKEMEVSSVIDSVMSKIAAKDVLMHEPNKSNSI